MTTQAVESTLVAHNGKAVRFTLTTTDDAWKILTDETNSLQLNQLMKGLNIVRHSSGYTAGALAIRVRNTSTGRIVAIGFGNIVTEMQVQEIFSGPFVVQDDDVIEGFAVEVPT